MEAEFVDRLLVCADCRRTFVFTAGEQIFFYDKQFKNDPKRCKPCKSKRVTTRTTMSAGVDHSANTPDSASPNPSTGSPDCGTARGPAAAGLARFETRTTCFECRIETTVPFRPTQNRPVLCRLCFQARLKAVLLQTQPRPEISNAIIAAAGTQPDLPHKSAS